MGVIIAIDVVLIVITFLFSHVYYNKHFSGPMAIIKVSALRNFQIFYGQIFALFPKFSNFSFNILLKGIITIICAIIISLTDIWWLAFLYSPYLLLSYFTCSKRTELYKDLSPNNQDLVKPVYRASFLIPIIHTLFYASLFFINL